MLGLVHLAFADPAPLPPHRIFPTAAAALDAVLVDHPRILAVGELHTTNAGPAVPSTLSVFTRDLFPVLAPHLTDLVLETWRIDGRCGEQAEVVSTAVQEATARPVEVKSDLALLVEAAVAAGVRPHDLAFSCAEYNGLLDPSGTVDLGRLLRLLTIRLGEYATRAADTPDATMVLYGGAVHNDLNPAAEVAEYSYTAPLAARLGPDLVELDLVQPELLTPRFTEPEWAPLLSLAAPDQVVLYARNVSSYVLLLPTVKPAQPPG